MNLNRNNYETFFLLYVDGELSPQEMLEVDAFCQKHPDLEEELQLLMDTRLAPDTDTLFSGKEDLLKPESWDADHLTPMQTTLLNLLDGETATDGLEEQLAREPQMQKEWEWLQLARLHPEAVPMAHKHQLIRALAWDADQLTPVQQQMLEALETGNAVPAGVLADPELHKDWMLLQQTRLVPETVVMPNKERLFRQEKPAQTPVIRLTWIRYVAAAAVLAGVGWVLFNSLSNTAPQAPQLSQQQKTSPAVQTPPVKTIDTPEAEQMPVQEPAAATPQLLLASNNDRKPQPAATVSTAVQVTTAAATHQPGSEQMASEIAAFRLTPQEEKALQESRAANVPNLQERGRAPIRARDYADAPEVLVASNNNQPATFQQAVMMEEDEEEYINIGGARVKAQKLRGVFRTVSRKVTRSFEKSTVAPAETVSSELR